MMRASAVVLIGLSVALAGCGKAANNPKGVKAAKTPIQALINFSTAVQTDDKGLFIASVYVPQDAQDLREAAFDLMAGMTKFSHDLERTYGKEAAATLQLTFPAPPTVEEIVTKMQIKEEGDKATAQMAGEDQVLLIRKDGLWMVDMSSDQPLPQDRAKALASSRAMAETVRRVDAKIGTRGYEKFESIHKEFAESMQRAVAQVSGEGTTTAPGPGR